MTADSLYNDLAAYCVANANDEIVKKYSRYFKGGYNGWGLTKEHMDTKMAELKKSGDLTLDLVFESAPLLMQSGRYEETSFVFSMMSMLLNQFQDKDIERLESLFSIGISNWAHADYLGMFLLPELIKTGVLSPERMDNWVASVYKFQRRCVPVTFIKLLRQNEDYSPLFNRLEPLMVDTEREVHQGMGWFLREAWKLNHALTEDFLMKWKDVSPRLIFQYACEKMKPEDKVKFKRVKI
ncbi:MAG: DNA alkylation repair protein [Lentimicrobiaceae bacterium]|nr:DNA alkylation repair protein [Lentimicrobiaceae bacterium]MCO5265761.1 DNA alkylation repair protein [Lentimicrobium sp.]HPG32232.1 DNA alkylation repair protein [Lentimicrobium sp.]